MVVHRGHAGVYETLKERFEPEAGGRPPRVLWDRRREDRRRDVRPADFERRRAERRRPYPATWTTLGFVLVPEPAAHLMRMRLPVVVVLALGLISALARPAGAFTMAAFDAKVIGVADGDTLTVLRDRAQIRVRLHGIDAPGRGQPFSARAKQFTSALAFGRWSA